MPKIFHKSLELKQHFTGIKDSIGFVPTMGNLHQGHLNLLEESIKENDISVISIFVNPTQFSENEDLDAYPRTFAKDLELITEVQDRYNKEVIIFHPHDPKEVYADSFDLISVRRFEKELEGELRPTHFAGVVTVVKRLFDIISPTRAYFGKKDYQQIIVISDMVRAFDLDIEIRSIDIAREPSGLAMSSRNNYLSLEDKEKALILRKTLLHLAQVIEQHGIKEAQDQCKEKLVDSNFNYLEIRAKESFQVPTQMDKDYVILGNYQINNTRLLDNIEVTNI